MNEKEITQFLQNLENNSDFGEASETQHTQDAWVRISNELGFDSDLGSESFTLREYLDYAMCSVARATAKPVAVALSIFIVIFGGGFTTVNTSMSSLPGEAMYPVKLAIEQVQLSFAFSAEQHAKLQVEFAGRRLEEMVDLASTSQGEDKSSQILLAMEQFKKEAQTIQNNLSGINGTDNAELARAVGRKVEVYSTTVSSSPDLNTEQVEQAVQEIIDETKDQAVEVFLSTHESVQDEESAKELAYVFSQDFQSTQEIVQKFTSEQINEGYKQFGITPEEYLQLSQELADQGAYRRAFQVLQEIEMIYSQYLIEAEDE
ncbi:MAG: hypothetical protein UU08_C0011G0007 [Candidatus Uhrbacteria bacterium GW2011_GWE2_40_58]|nr:MAG: hypothetical protein UT94_C0010G0011 [Candidatus Uhrbacteria bacterium GW2011_GWF2_40_263]KKR67678.1 MAG: hypothetical protein UU08_C0011G0007 [Candidatus Uhrbacteria bacterium GW2011_GWE2_40_58]OGL94109.1 MAG: hypothetical protein A2239_02595 [Candidatus Uhrbacteria bacterium RIFOXYA2_FULL_40_9]OGL96569.1 MAG: hypothetical protein A2332_00035 [Candidatus Uhrbacteria bacterium RIFOXYB2_FULL_41_18]HBK35318.1 hypothetical protein [Candidatus Uhrbacteria bacterium]